MIDDEKLFSHFAAALSNFRSNPPYLHFGWLYNLLRKMMRVLCDIYILKIFLEILIFRLQSLVKF